MPTLVSLSRRRRENSSRTTSISHNHDGGGTVSTLQNPVCHWHLASAWPYHCERTSPRPCVTYLTPIMARLKSPVHSAKANRFPARLKPCRKPPRSWKRSACKPICKGPASSHTPGSSTPASPPPAPPIQSWPVGPTGNKSKSNASKKTWPSAPSSCRGWSSHRLVWPV